MRHLASFRVRVFLSIVLVAVAATGATAWLTLRGATTQITETVTAQRETAQALSGELSAYGVRHGTWEGVAGLVADLTTRSGQRLRLTTLEGGVVVDSEHLAGRAARPPSSASPSVLQPRPTLDLAGVRPAAVFEIATKLIDQYRQQVRQAACLTRHDVPLPAPKRREFGVPMLDLPLKTQLTPAAVQECLMRTASTAQERRDDAVEIKTCDEAPTPTTPPRHPISSPGPEPGGTQDPADPLRHCVAAAFAARADVVAPVPLLLYLGFERQGDVASKLSLAHALPAAGAVALVVVAGTVLLSRRVARPIGTVTAAARRLGAGDLSGRVAVRGHDELAELARAFNRMAEQLQLAEERQRRMIGDIAHELRTPLANVRGYLEALSDGVLTPSPELFASLHEEAVLQQRIVDDLQELALAEAGALRYRHVPVDVAGHGVALRVDIGDGLTVAGDPDRLRQAVGNLVTNALNATPPGGAVTLRGSRGDGWIVVEVADTGHGIAHADQARVFDRFWRADAARSRRTGGSGLGLAITREFVTAHGGTVTVASEPGVGTVFTVSLPAAAPEAG